MCTVLIGRDVTGPGEILVAANRDEDPARPSDPPRILNESPRVAGGRDRLAGGTWLAVRAGSKPSVTMLLNRRPIPGARPGTRSRGLLTLDVARAGDPRAAARTAAVSGQYGPCTLVHVSASSCWWLAIPGAGGGDVRMGDIPSGWHAITHAELDDAGEPRTAWLMDRLAGLTTHTVEPALASLAALLAHHGDATSPAVCIHEGRMTTVSAALLALTPERMTWRHAEGRPCEAAFSDASTLLLRERSGPANAEAP